MGAKRARTWGGGGEGGGVEARKANERQII